MKTNGTLVHPELTEFINICTISPDGSKEICELVQRMEINAPKERIKAKKNKKAKKDKDLDRDLKDTFPASDPFTHY